MIGTATSPARATRISAHGAEAIVLDLLDPGAVRYAVLEARPDAIVHQATALADIQFSKNLDSSFVQTNRLRIEGTDALLMAAHEAGVSRFVTQSFASLRYEREGGMVENENSPARSQPTQRDARDQRRDELPRRSGHRGRRDRAPLRPLLRSRQRRVGLAHPGKRQFLIVGDGGGFSSSIHLDDAASATVLALDRRSEGWGPAIYNIVDDEPAPAREWLPVLAEALGADPPRRFPVWLARLFAGEIAVMMGTEVRGASNAKAKQELGWTLRYQTWRQGFFEAYATPEGSDVAEVSDCPLEVCGLTRIRRHEEGGSPLARRGGGGGGGGPLATPRALE